MHGTTLKPSITPMTPATSDLFASASTTNHGTSIRAGIGGWNYAPWRNNFYPTGLVQRRELEYASRQLRAIEINGTYYGAQKAATYAKWAAETPEGFVFSLKAPRYITEGKRLAEVGVRWPDDGRCGDCRAAGRTADRSA